MPMKRVLLCVWMLGGAGCLELGASSVSPKDTRSPSVVGVFAFATADLPQHARFRIDFSEYMDSASLIAGLQLESGGAPYGLAVETSVPLGLPPDLEYFDVQYTVRAVPTSRLPPGTYFELVLGTELTDYAGNPLPAEVRLPFVTTNP
jgi:hypothetical protein